MEDKMENGKWKIRWRTKGDKLLHRGEDDEIHW